MAIAKPIPRRAPSRANGFSASTWKQVSSSLAMLLIAGVGFFMLEGRSHVDRGEVEAKMDRLRADLPGMIDAASPYSRDKQEIFYRFDVLEDRLVTMGARMDASSAATDKRLESLAEKLERKGQ